jgi:hypothetical protein
MTWLRALPVRIVLGIAVVLVIIGTHMAVPKQRLPFVLIDSFDKAYALVEQPKPTLHQVFALIEAELTVACDAASDALDAQLAQLHTLSAERRALALEVAVSHLVDARENLAHAIDADEYREYDAMCERLRDVRRLLA